MAQDRKKHGNRKSSEDNFFNIKFTITKTYEHSDGKWKPKKPDFEKLMGRWVVIEPHILSLDDPRLCLIQDDEDYFFDNESIPVKFIVNPLTLVQDDFTDLNPNSIRRISVLEAPSVTKAKGAIREVESEHLEKALEPSLASYAYTILRLKRDVEDPLVSELINYLREKIDAAEDSSDEADILGEKLAGGPSRKKKELEEFVSQHDVVKQFADKLEKHGEEVDELSAQDMLEEMRKRSDGRTSFLLNRYRQWMEILAGKRNRRVDEVIRELYFEASLEWD